MTNTTRPVTVTDVHAWLEGRADFRGIPDASGRAHYLLGMCESLLADAYRELNRLEKTVVDVRADIAEAQALLGKLASHDEDCDCERCGSERARDAEVDRQWKEARLDRQWKEARRI